MFVPISLVLRRFIISHEYSHNEDGFNETVISTKIINSDEVINLRRMLIITSIILKHTHHTRHKRTS